MMKKTILLAVMFLTSCAPYYENGGVITEHSRKLFAENIVRVNFIGKEHIEGQYAYDMGMLSFAETTLLDGYKYFIVKSADDDDIIFTNSGPLHSILRFLDKPSSDLTVMVIMFNDKPKDEPSYDAAFLAKSIRTKYKIMPKSISYEDWLSMTEKSLRQQRNGY